MWIKRDPSAAHPRYFLQRWLVTAKLYFDRGAGYFISINDQKCQNFITIISNGLLFCRQFNFTLIH